MKIQHIVFVLLTLLLASCGGEGNSNNPGSSGNALSSTPTNLTFTQEEETSVKLTWQGKEGSRYFVHIANASFEGRDVDDYSDLPNYGLYHGSSTPSRVFERLTRKETYYFVVTAREDFKDPSGPSNEVSVFIPEETLTTSTPNLEAFSGDQSVHLTLRSADGAYNTVHRATQSFENIEVANYNALEGYEKSDPTTASFMTIDGLDPDIYYFVATSNEEGKHGSAPSPEVSVALVDYRAIGKGSVYQTAHHPSEQKFLVVSTDFSLYVYSYSNDERVSFDEKITLEHTLRGHRGYIYSAVFSPDGSKIMSHGTDESLRVWDVLTGELLHMSYFEDGLDSVVFSPDSNKIAAISDFHTKVKVTVLDAASGSQLQEFDLDINDKIGGNSKKLIFSPDGSKIAVFADRKKIDVWDIEQDVVSSTLALNFSEGRRLEEHRLNDVISMFFSSDGTEFSVIEFDKYNPDLDVDESNIKVHTWNVQSGKQIAPALDFGSEEYAYVSQNGNYLLAQHRDELTRFGIEATISIWDIEKNAEVRTLNGYDISLDSAALSLDGRNALLVDHDGSIHIWDIENSTASRMFYFSCHSGGTHSMALSGDGSRVAIGAYDWQRVSDLNVCVLDTESGLSIRELSGQSGYAVAVAFSPSDHGKIASSAAQAYPQSVSLWDIDSREVKSFEIKPMRYERASVAFSPDGTKIASGHDEGFMLWGINNPEEPLLDIPTSYTVSSVVFSPDGNNVASGGLGAVSVWDAYHGNQQFEIQTESTWWVVAFSPNGDLLAGVNTLGRDKDNVYIWDAESGDEILVFELERNPYSVAFSPDGKKLLIGGSRGVYIFDVETGEQTMSLEGQGNIHSIAFSVDGSVFASGGTNNTIRIWDIDPFLSE